MYKKKFYQDSIWPNSPFRRSSVNLTRKSSTSQLTPYKVPAPTPTKSRPTRYWSTVYKDQCHKLSQKVSVVLLKNYVALLYWLDLLTQLHYLNMAVVQIQIQIITRINFLLINLTIYLPKGCSLNQM